MIVVRWRCLSCENKKPYFSSTHTSIHILSFTSAVWYQSLVSDLHSAGVYPENCSQPHTPQFWSFEWNFEWNFFQSIITTTNFLCSSYLKSCIMPCFFSLAVLISYSRKPGMCFFISDSMDVSSLLSNINTIIHFCFTYNFCLPSVLFLSHLGMTSVHFILHFSCCFFSHTTPHLPFTCFRILHFPFSLSIFCYLAK